MASAPSANSIIFCNFRSLPKLQQLPVEADTSSVKKAFLTSMADSVCKIVDTANQGHDSYQEFVNMYEDKVMLCDTLRGPNSEVHVQVDNAHVISIYAPVSIVIQKKDCIPPGSAVVVPASIAGRPPKSLSTDEVITALGSKDAMDKLLQNRQDVRVEDLLCNLQNPQVLALVEQMRATTQRTFMVPRTSTPQTPQSMDLVSSAPQLISNSAPSAKVLTPGQRVEFVANYTHTPVASA